MYLGIDVGTSGVKAVVLSPAGAVVGQSTAPLTVSRPQESWSEQDPADWWAATETATLSLGSALRAQVTAIGIAGQMHGATLLGGDDRPLRPAILWNDGRSVAECELLDRRVPQARAITGNLAMPGFTAPKLLWMAKHEPHWFEQIRTVLLPKDYVRLCLTGDKASDMSDSAGTLWLDVAGRDWSDVLLAATGLRREQMPLLYEGNAVTGRVRADVAARWGIGQVPVVAGGSDNAAGAVGVGVVRDGDALLSLGTSGVIFVATDTMRANPARAVHAFCHCLPDLWHQMSVHLAAASCIDWAARLVGRDGAAAVFALAEASGIAAGPEVFLPYLSGERTPHNDAQVRGAFLCMDHESTPGRLAAAVLEGVAFALADGLDALRAAGTRVDELAVIGGGARSLHWGRIIATALNVRLIYLEGGEVGPALGAAKLAQFAGAGASLAEICTKPSIRHVIEPDAGLADRLAAKLDAFRAAYPAVRSL